MRRLVAVGVAALAVALAATEPERTWSLDLQRPFGLELGANVAAILEGRERISYTDRDNGESAEWLQASTNSIVAVPGILIARVDVDSVSSRLAVLEAMVEPRAEDGGEAEADFQAMRALWVRQLGAGPTVTNDAIHQYTLKGLVWRMPARDGATLEYALEKVRTAGGKSAVTFSIRHLDLVREMDRRHAQERLDFYERQRVIAVEELKRRQAAGKKQEDR